MGLLPREATYAEEVTDFFLAFRGAGVSLSPLDADQLLAWQDQGVPYEVVCRGIRRAAEKRARDLRPGEPSLRSLRACARAVDEEFRRFRGLSTGRSASAGPAAAPKPIDRLARARAALAKAAREGGPELQQAIARVRPLAQGSEPDPARAAFRLGYLDDALALAYLRALSFPARLGLLRQARGPLGESLRRMSPRARKASLRAHRVLQARAHGKLPPLK
jgi:hypothetical protein